MMFFFILSLIPDESGIGFKSSLEKYNVWSTEPWHTTNYKNFNLLLKALEILIALITVSISGTKLNHTRF